MSSPKVIVNSTPVVKVNYGLPAVGVPKGGSKPQVLKKSSDTDYDTEWGAPVQVYVELASNTTATPPNLVSYKGGAVYLGSSNQVLSSVNTDSSTLPPIGLMVGGTSSDPEIISNGVLFDVDTSSFTVGDRLYVGASIGELLSTPPSENAYFVGTVLKSHATEGTILVAVGDDDSSFEGLDENKVWIGNSSGIATQYEHQLKRLTDVDSSLSPTSDQVLKYSGSQWEAVDLGFDVLPLDQLNVGQVYAGNSSNQATATDTIYVDIANSRVGIGTTSPTESLQVSGHMRLRDSTNNTLIGTSWNSLTTGNNNVSVGAGGLQSVSTGNYNVAVGDSAAKSITSQEYTVAIGYSAAEFLVPSGSTSLNTLVGTLAGRGSNGNSTYTANTAMGYRALLKSTTGGNNTSIGAESTYNQTTGSSNTALGRRSLFSNISGADNVAIGYYSLYYSTGDANVAVGRQSLEGSSGNSTFTQAVAVGYQSLQDLTTGARTTAVGYRSGTALTTGTGNTLVGHGAGLSLTTQGKNTLIGESTVGTGGSVSVGASANAGSFSIAIGQESDVEDTAVGIGYLANVGDDSVAIGHISRAETESVAVGRESGRYNQGQHNVAIGYKAGIGQDTVNGSNYDYNVLIGYQAGEVLEGGSGNILIGYRAGQTLENQNHKLYIAGQAQEATGTPLIYGEFDNELVKVNGDLEVRDEIVSSSGADIVINPDGAGRVVMGNYEFDVDQVVGEATDNYVLTYDDATGEILLKENIQEVEGATEITFAIRNDEGASIAAGTPLYSKGEIGASERIKVGIADASDPNKMPSIGIAKDTLADGADGDAMIMGTFNTNLTGYTGADENQVLYVAVGGGLPTNVKPTGSGNLIQNVGIVLKANGAGTQVQGFKVSCIGRTNDVPNLATGNIWAGNASGVATATSVAYIDTANSRVGIGTTSPGEKLHVAGQIKIDDGANPYTLPAADGAASGYILETDGAGTVSWVANSGGGISELSEDTSPQLGGNLDVYDGTLTRTITTTKANGDVSIQPNGTGNVLLGDYEFDGDQAPAAGLDNYVLTYDHVSRTISLEASQGDVSTTGTIADNEVPFFSSGDLATDTGFNFNNDILTVPMVTQDKIRQLKPSAASAVGSFGANSDTVSKFGTNVNVTAGKVYDASGGSFTVSDADAESSSKGLLAVASATGTTNGTDMVLRGFVKLSSNTHFSSASLGDPLYLKESSGQSADEGLLTATAPTGTGDIVRIAGYVSDATNAIVYFNPDNSYIEV